MFLFFCAFGGYFEYYGQIISVKDSLKYTGYERMSLKIKERTENLYFFAEPVFTHYHGILKYDLCCFIPDSLIPPDFSLPFEYRSSVYLRNAFLRWRFLFFEAQIGKQQIGWGTGYVFNPENVFQRKNIIDPSYELDGISLLRVRAEPLPLSEIDFLYLPPQDTVSANYGLRFHSLIKGLDLSLGGVKKTRYVSDSLFLLKEKDDKGIIADFAMEVSGFNVYGEFLKWKEGSFIVLGGVTYLFSDGLTTFLLEYLYNGEGKNDYSLGDYILYLSGNSLTMGRHEIYFNITRDLEFNKVNLSFVLNPEDFSGMVIFNFRYSISDEAWLIFSSFFPFGKGGEYSFMHKGAFLRIRKEF